jgi:DNA-binding NarL/FixJ family response regulator
MKADQTPIKIIIADDHPVCLSGFKKMLDLPGFELIGEATNGKELIDLARNLKPDIIITDIKMPHMDGIEATKQIIKELPSIGIIAMSMIDEYNLIMDMVDAGAKGYLLKSAKAEEIIAAVDAVIKGETYYCKETTSHMVEMLARSDYKAIQENAKSQFSERELEIIKLIREEYSNKEIANKLKIKKRTVEWHREQILQKLNSKNTAGIVAFAIKNNI